VPEFRVQHAPLRRARRVTPFIFAQNPLLPSIVSIKNDFPNPILVKKYANESSGAKKYAGNTAAIPVFVRPS